MSKLTQSTKKPVVPLSPKSFAFGGGNRPLSRILFNKYDTDESGFISRAELHFLCYDMGYFLSDKQLDWAFTLIDKDGNGKISYEEFLSWWRNQSRFHHLQLSDEGLYTLHIITDLFRSHDEKNRGELDKNQFRKLYEHLIENNIVDPSQNREFDEIDLNHDGRINFNELIAWLYDQGVLLQLGVLSNENKE